MKRLITKIVMLSAALAVIACLQTPAPSAFAADAEFSSPNACTGAGEAACDSAQEGDSPCAKNVNDCATFQVIRGVTAFFIAFVGVAAVISIIIGGIQYTSSAGDPQKAAAGRRRIINTIIALVMFFFLSALLNFLVPGGIV